MTLLGKTLSVTGLILALLYIIIAVSIFYSTRETRGEGAIIQLFVTFPWFFISVATKIPLWVWIIPNSIITYFIGAGIESLIRKLFDL